MKTRINCHFCNVKSQVFGVLLIGLTALLANSGHAAPNLSVPDGRQHPSLVVRLGHSKAVQSVAISADGKTILSGGADNFGCLWDANSGREIRRFNHGDAVSSVSLTPDGMYAVTASEDQVVRVWNLNDVNPVNRIGEPNKYGYGKYPAPVSPDGRFVLYIQGPFSSDSEHFATLKEKLSGKTIRVFENIRKIRGRANTELMFDVTSAQFSSDGTHIIMGTSSGTGLAPGETSPYNSALLWNTKTGLVERRFLDAASRSGASAVEDVDISTDGKTALTGHKDGSIRLWDTKNGRMIGIPFESRSPLYCVRFSPQGDSFLSGHNNGAALLWSVKSRAPRRKYTDRSIAVLAVAFSSDGKRFVTGSQDHTVRLWRIDKPTPLMRFAPNGVENTSHVSISKSVWKTNACYATSSGKMVMLWQPQSRQIVRRLRCKSEITALALSANGQFLATGDISHVVTVWETSTGRKLWPLLPLSGAISDITFLADAKKLLVTGEQEAVLFEVGSGLRWLSFDGRNGVISADNHYIATSRAKKVVLWDAKTGVELDMVPCASEVTHLNFGPTSRQLLTGNAYDFTLFSIAATERQPAKFLDSDWTINSDAGVALSSPISTFSQNGRMLALAQAGTNTFTVVDVKNGAVKFKDNGLVGPISGMAYSPDDSCLLLTGQWTQLFSTNGYKNLAYTVSFKNGLWVTVKNDERFDTNGVDTIRSLRWTFPDDPLKTLPLEIFMRDYYEPQLLSRVLAGDNMPALPSLFTLNRVQPMVAFGDSTQDVFKP